MHLMVMILADGSLELLDGFTRVQVLGASVGAVHDLMASVELVGIIDVGKSLVSVVITGIGDPSVGLLENWARERKRGR